MYQVWFTLCSFLAIQLMVSKDKTCASAPCELVPGIPPETGGTRHMRNKNALPGLSPGRQDGGHDPATGGYGIGRDKGTLRHSLAEHPA